MCTPIVIDTPQLDLSKDPTATPMAPVGTGDTAPPAGGGLTDTAIGSDAPPVAAKKTVGGVTTGPSPAPDGTAVPLDPSGPIAMGGGPGATGPRNIDGGGPTTVNPGTDGTAPGTPLDTNALLINSLTTLAHQFTDSTSGILKAQSDAASALHSGFMDLTQQQQDALAAADQLRKNTGQASRAPSYSLSLQANRKSNSSGVSSTMLTGSGGVPTNTLALGRAQLLGGEAA